MGSVSIGHLQSTLPLARNWPIQSMCIWAQPIDIRRRDRQHQTTTTNRQQKIEPNSTLVALPATPCYCPTLPATAEDYRCGPDHHHRLTASCHQGPTASFNHGPLPPHVPVATLTNQSCNRRRSSYHCQITVAAVQDHTSAETHALLPPTRPPMFTVILSSSRFNYSVLQEISNKILHSNSWSW